MAPLMSGLPQWVAWLYGFIAAVAAFTDYREGKIYNWLTLPAIVLGICLSAFFGVEALVSALKGFGLATFIFLPLFFTGVLGGGDVKLLMALGTVLGARGMLELASACIVVASLGAVALLFKHRRVRIFFSQIWMFFRSLILPGLVVQWPKLSREIKAPFGIAIFAGFIYVLLRGGG